MRAMHNDMQKVHTPACVQGATRSLPAKYFEPLRSPSARK